MTVAVPLDLQAILQYFFNLARMALVSFSISSSFFMVFSE